MTLVFIATPAPLITTKEKAKTPFLFMNKCIVTVFGVFGPAVGESEAEVMCMAPERNRKYVGRICALPKEQVDLVLQIEKARRGGLLGADRAGGW